MSLETSREKLSMTACKHTTRIRMLGLGLKRIKKWLLSERRRSPSMLQLPSHGTKYAELAAICLRCM